MTAPARPFGQASSPTRLGWGLAAVLALGAGGVVLALMHSRLFDLERHTVPKELVLHLTALAGLLFLLPRWRAVRLSLVDALMVAWTGWGAISALFATNPWLALRAWGVTASGAVVYAMARHAAAEGAGRVVTRVIAVAGLLAALTGLAQAYGFDWGLFVGERAPGGTIGNRNFLAHLTALTLPLMTLAALEARGRAGWVAGALGCALMAAAIVLTRSRAAWLALLAAGAVVAATALVARVPIAGPVRRRLLGLGTVLLAGVALALAVPNQLAWRADNPYGETLRGLVNYQEGSGRGRLVQYRNTLAMVRMDPVFGTGPGNWMVHYPRVTTPGDPSFAGADPLPTNPWPSSDWVAFLAERGAIGVLLLLGMGLAVLVMALRRLQDPEAKGHALVLLAVLTVTGVTGMFDAVLLLAPPTLCVMAALGALVPASGLVLEHTPSPRRMRIGRVLLLGTGLLLVAQSALAARSIALTGASSRRAELVRAVRLDPGNHRLHLMLAIRGSCAERRPHARRALALLPYHPWAQRAARSCGVPTR